MNILPAPPYLAKKLACWITILCSGCLAFVPFISEAANPQSKWAIAVQTMELKSLSAPPISLDISGGFAGRSGGFYVVAGSQNSGQETVHLWTLSEKDSGRAWKDSGQALPRWAAFTQWNDSIILAGGEIDGRLTGRVIAIQADANGKMKLKDLPTLPTPVAGAGAAVIKEKLYVIGGVSSLEMRTLQNSLWSLDLKNPAAKWESEASLPGASRAFAAVTAQYDVLCVFGGLQAGSNGAMAAASKETWIFHPKPPEATQRKGWSRMADMPRAILGACAFPVGQASVALIGGGGKPGSMLFPTEAQTESNEPPLLFHTLTDAWCPFDHPEAGTFFGVSANPSAPNATTVFFSNPLGGSQLEISEFHVIRNSRTLNGLDYVIIVLYFCFISLIGFIASKKQKSSSEFALGGRRIPWWVAGISMFATGASAISLMSIPALAFASNLVFLFPIFIMIGSYFVQAHLIFPLLRRMEITSTYEYLERRFNRTLRLIASAQCILFQTFGRASVVLVLPSLAISATTGIPAWKSVLMMGTITTIYTTFGGFNAVVWTDVFQGMLKFFAPLCMIILCLANLPGGPKEFVDVGLAHHKFDFALLTWDATLPAFWILLLGTFLASTIVQAGDQPVIQRVFSAPDHEVRRVAAMSAACGILISIVVNVLGVAIFAYFHAHPSELDPLAQNDKIMPLFVIQALPHGAVGMVIAAIFASAMTTVGSSMISSATVFTEDFFLRWKPEASDKLRLRVLRTTSYLVGAIAVCMALFLSKQNTKSFMQVWTIVSALLGGGIVGIYSLGMFTKRANGFGAVCGVIASLIITALVQFKTPLHWQTLLPIAILSCMIFGYLCSFFSHHAKPLEGLTVFTPKKNEDSPQLPESVAK